MRKAFFLVLALVAFMQGKAQVGLHVGLMAGPQYTMILNNQPIDGTGKGFAYIPTWGRTATLKIGYNFVPPIGVHSAVTYSEQGQDYSTLDSTGAKTITTRKQKYIKIPLLVHLSSTPGPIMFVMEFGPQIGILQDASFSVTGGADPLGFEADLLWRPVDIDLAWCFGAEFGITKGFHLVVQQRGDYGLWDMENKTLLFNGLPFYPTGRRRAVNFTASIVVGFNFIPYFGHSKVTRHYKGRTWRNNWR